MMLARTLKNTLDRILIVCAYGLITGLITLGSLLIQPAMATPDLEVGRQAFNSNCAACHMGGRNTVVAAKNLKLDALRNYHMDTAEAIISQVTNGKNAMPAFGRRLKPEQIESVAAYVLDQAEKDWPRG